MGLLTLLRVVQVEIGEDMIELLTNRLLAPTGLDCCCRDGTIGLGAGGGMTRDQPAAEHRDGAFLQKAGSARQLQGWASGLWHSSILSLSQLDFVT
jgi:hypothetical protein